jgi:hypothetical protein
MAVNRDDYNSLLEQSAQRVPYWARSNNPIVRRHLGLNWRTIPPEMTPLLFGMGAWLIALILSLFIPILQTLVSTLVIAAVIVLPFAAALYAHVLLSVAITASDIMHQEVQNDTLALLRATPMSLSQILLGKIAVALWKRMDDLVLISQVVLFFTPSIFLSGHAVYWSMRDQPVMGITMIMLGLIVSLMRLIIEPLFVGVIAILVAVIVPGRSVALTASVAFSVFYFVMLNLVVHLPGIRGDILANGTVIPPNLPLLFMADFALPVVLPIAAGLLALRLAVRIVGQD